MSFKTGVVIGLAVGYYFGSKAGHERYEQIEGYLQPLRESDAFQQASEIARGLFEETLGAARSAFRDVTAADGAVIEIRKAG
jgi:hypothetical protein